MQPQGEAMRNVYFLVSPRSLRYAGPCMGSLFRNALEPLSIRLITDSRQDKETLAEAVGKLEHQGRHVWAVWDQDEAGERAEEQYRGLEDLLRFRRDGHPCWRKVTDPPLFAAAGEEMIILDPDVYFPNRFTFESTPAQELVLMWQRPNCLLPPQTVAASFAAPAALADHVDIGVAQWRGPVDKEWLNWLVGRLGGAAIPRMMHVEAIVWAALAMRMGGGYLDPQRWICWHRTQWKRLALRCGAKPLSILRTEPLAHAKCFHAGGVAKDWLAEAEEAGLLNPGQQHDQPSPIRRFVSFPPARFHAQQRVRNVARRLGYYAIFK
ncbi:MAG: hypothetical protein IT443_01110 [Phycisphaeraceae bacterium]|nr:hypothetical protein [Phycisphaeraceae bacterium]